MSEHQTMEYKQTWRSEYLKWICGFANAQGGELVIGKNDQGQVAGIQNAPKLLEDIPNQVRDLMGILVDVDLHQQDGLDYLVIKIEPYPYPVSLKGAYHYRCGSTKQELKGAALDRFLLRKIGKHWDGVPVPYVNVEDFSEQAFQKFRTLALNSKRLAGDILDEENSALVENYILQMETI
jgi:ATP-dependent DNA helicase RecG